MSDVKKEKKSKKSSKESTADIGAAAAAQDTGLHLKSEDVTKPIDTKDWPLLLKVRALCHTDRERRCRGIHSARTRRAHTLYRAQTPGWHRICPQGSGYLAH